MSVMIWHSLSPLFSFLLSCAIVFAAIDFRPSMAAAAAAGKLPAASSGGRRRAFAAAGQGRAEASRALGPGEKAQSSGAPSRAAAALQRLLSRAGGAMQGGSSPWRAPLERSLLPRRARSLPLRLLRGPC